MAARAQDARTPGARLPAWALLAPALLAAAGCQRMRRPPAHGTIKARAVDVYFDGLRPMLVADLRVEVIGALGGNRYELGPAFAAPALGHDAGGLDWLCLDEACSTPVDTSVELYPVELRYPMDQLVETAPIHWPPTVRFEVRELLPAGAPRLVQASTEKSLAEACARLARVPLRLREAGREKPRAEGELTVEAAAATAGCEGPVLHLELAHRVLPLPGTAPVVRIAVGIPGFPETACRGLHCVVPLEPPDRGTAVIDKPLGACFAALRRPATRAQVHVVLERRRVNADGRIDLEPGGGGEDLDHHLFELISPGAGVVP
ncbi:MAG: hypothetical protein JXB32_05985 [Deltaproteobacteria bacterium]|nr:hypothetical protein [Deltaproteobacteria bacterium]